VISLNSVLLFSKAPLKRFVKTRLQKQTSLDESEVVFLYEAFLKDVFQSALSSKAQRIYVSFYPEGKRDLIASSISGGEYQIDGERIVFFPQKGRDFDERFTNAVEKALMDSDKVVVIGGDSPHIQPKTIDKALELLNKTECMVLGPSREGGVYLVGVERPMDFTSVFTTGVESENLAALAKKNAISLHLLEELTDIDVASDLADFICNIKAMEYAAGFSNFKLPKHSIRAVRKLGLSVNEGPGGERSRQIIKSN
jgi:glycosyltransferase A (GT-A) superfamily protein (DUF2064 family)